MVDENSLEWFIKKNNREARLVNMFHCLQC